MTQEKQRQKTTIEKIQALQPRDQAAMLGVRYNRILFRRIYRKIEFNYQRREMSDREMSDGITIRFLPIILGQISDKLL